MSLSIYKSGLRICELAIHIYYIVHSKRLTQVQLLFSGANNANIPKIIHIIAEAFHMEVMEPSSTEGARMLNIVRQVQSNESFFQTVVQTMTPEQQQALHAALHATPVS